MTYPYYTVEFTVEVGKDLASNPHMAAVIAQHAVSAGECDCRVTLPSTAKDITTPREVTVELPEVTPAIGSA